MDPGVSGKAPARHHGAPQARPVVPERRTAGPGLAAPVPARVCLVAVGALCAALWVGAIPAGMPVPPDVVATSVASVAMAPPTQPAPVVAAGRPVVAAASRQPPSGRGDWRLPQRTGEWISQQWSGLVAAVTLEPSGELAHQLALRLHECQPMQLARAQQVFVVDASNAETVSADLAAFRQRRCGFSSDQLAQAQATLDLAARKGWPAARLDQAQAVLARSGEAGEMDPTTPAHSAAWQQTVQDVRQLAQAGHPQAWLLMADLAAAHPGDPDLGDDFLVFSLLSQRVAGDDTPFERSLLQRGPVQEPALTAHDAGA
jgi:hypothetical protein